MEVMNKKEKNNSLKLSMGVVCKIFMWIYVIAKQN
jgi:hypothetical protein